MFSRSLSAFASSSCPRVCSSSRRANPSKTSASKWVGSPAWRLRSTSCFSSSSAAGAVVFLLREIRFTVTARLGAEALGRADEGYHRGGSHGHAFHGTMDQGFGRGVAWGQASRYLLEGWPPTSIRPAGGAP